MSAVTVEPQAPVVTREGAERELGRFLQLAVELRVNLTMFSEYVDEAWHDLLSQPDAYRAFCVETCGMELGHIPSGEDNPIVEVEWIAEYEGRYGNLTAEWFASTDGEVLQDDYDAYLRDHTVTASWVCAPAQDGDDDWTPGAIIPQS